MWSRSLLLLLPFFVSCSNPDCDFAELTPPIVLTSKSFDYITCVDAEGKIWTSSTGWGVAKSILIEGHSVGDTIIKTNK